MLDMDDCNVGDFVPKNQEKLFGESFFGLAYKEGARDLVEL